MSIPLTGAVSRSAGIVSAIGKQLKSLNLKPVSKIIVQFDPFEEQVGHARRFLYYLSAPKTQSTNLACILKTNVVCDRSPPLITCDLNNGEKIIFKCGNLNTLDILTLYNKHISSLVPKEEPAETGRPKRKRKLKVKRRIARSRK